MQADRIFNIHETELEFGNEKFIANNHRTLFHAQSHCLLLADCHFGKTSHSRKNDMAIPGEAGKHDFQILQSLLDHYQPLKCIILGDLFHSNYNPEWEWIKMLIKKNDRIAFYLVLGNHDILPVFDYCDAGFQISRELVFLQKFKLTHEPENSQFHYNICGHIHPGINLQGKARQHVSLPCFFLTENRLYLPSFGKLTGHVNVAKQEKKGKAWIFTSEKIFEEPVIL